MCVCVYGAKFGFYLLLTLVKKTTGAAKSSNLDLCCASFYADDSIIEAVAKIELLLSILSDSISFKNESFFIIGFLIATSV